MSIPRVLTLGWCVFALSTASAHAADNPTVGVVVGANLASAGLSGLDATGISVGRKAGIVVGGFALLPITSWIGIQPEVAYSQKHFTVKDTIGAFTATEKWDWVEVPLVARVAVWHTPARSLYVVAGPAVGFLARAKEETGGATSDVKADITRVDVSIVGGAGVSIGRFAVEARYDGGLTDLNKEHLLGDDLTVKSRTVTIDVRWSLR